MGGINFTEQDENFKEYNKKRLFSYKEDVKRIRKERDNLLDICDDYGSDRTVASLIIFMDNQINSTKKKIKELKKELKNE